MSDRSWHAVDTPALLVDGPILDANIRRMADLAANRGLALRPHFKTHKSVGIARLQLEAGAIGFTVATLDEAEVLVQSGIPDVFLAVEIVSQVKLERAAELTRRSRLSLAVDGIEGAQRLAAVARRHSLTLDVLLEIDSGLRRCGVRPADSRPLAERLVELPGLSFRGVFTHGGHAYAAGPDGVAAVAEEEAAAVIEAAEAIRSAGIAVDRVSLGSTPTLGAAPQSDRGVTEVRPGTYVFNDRLQVALGTVDRGACALTVAASVISRPIPERVVIDAGSKTLGLDLGAQGSSLLRGYGELVDWGIEVGRLSEEHGIIELPRELPLAVGDTVRVLPNHACSVVNLARELTIVEDDRVIERLPIEASGGVH